jgi:hypothetical protein
MEGSNRIQPCVGVQATKNGNKGQMNSEGEKERNRAITEPHKGSSARRRGPMNLCAYVHQLRRTNIIGQATPIVKFIGNDMADKTHVTFVGSI